MPACVRPSICHLGHCLGGVKESGAGNTMMSLNVVEAQLDGDRDLDAFVIGKTERKGTKPEHMKYT